MNPGQTETVAEPAVGEAPLPAEELEGRPTIVALAPDAPVTKVDSRGTALVTLAVLATLFALRAAAEFVVPVLIGILLAYALDPAVSWLARCRIPRWLGALVVLGSLVAASALSVYSLRHQAQAIIDQVPAVVTKVQRVVDVFEGGGSGIGIDRIRRAADALQKATDQATGAAAPPAKGTVVVVQQAGNSLKDYFLVGGRGVLAMFGQLVMVVFLTYFILLSGDQFRRKFVKVAGRTLSAKKITVQMFDAINLSIQRFMAMLLVANVVLAITTWIVFRMIGLANAGTWGVVAGVLHIVPYFGPVLVAAATGVAALVQFGSIGTALLVAGSSIAVATLVGIVLTTWMAGRIARMNTVSIFIGLLLFGWLWGVWGVLLAVPIVVIVKVVADHVEELKALSEFLGD